MKITMHKIITYSVSIFLLFIVTASTTLQSDQEKSNLLVYTDAGGNVRTIKTVKEWQNRRNQILDFMQLVMGPFTRCFKESAS